jgi:hypothetical protein
MGCGLVGVPMNLNWHSESNLVNCSFKNSVFVKMGRRKLFDHAKGSDYTSISCTPNSP